MGHRKRESTTDDQVVAQYRLSVRLRKASSGHSTIPPAKGVRPKWLLHLVSNHLIGADETHRPVSLVASLISEARLVSGGDAVGTEGCRGAKREMLWS